MSGQRIERGNGISRARLGTRAGATAYSKWGALRALDRATALRGRPFDLFGMQVPSLMVTHKAWAMTAADLHALGAFGLGSLVLFHAGAAILHRIIADDGVLDSMLPVPRRVRGARVDPLPEP